MASMFLPSKTSECRLIDPGAGIGSLSAAFMNRFVRDENCFKSVQVTAFELDRQFHELLKTTLESFSSDGDIQTRIESDDFIESAVNLIQFSPDARYTHAILNPPYKKINNSSRHRLLLQQVGLQTVNLYSAFVALSLELLVPGGQLVAIIPRSFCNGPYYRPFRGFLFARSAIRRIHLFASRNRAFKDDNVLQENVIIHLERTGKQRKVSISTSTDHTLTDLAAHEHAFEQIVSSNDSERFIHIPIAPESKNLEPIDFLSSSLEDIGVQVSTGPVVDFRLREHLLASPEKGSVPLIYPGHFGNCAVEWPNVRSKKSNALNYSPATAKWLYPCGFYAVVRRFSAKEEKRRIVANVLDPSMLGNPPMLGFENHLNVFHKDRAGLTKSLAYGLSLFLNSTVADSAFRRFSGHTQVNATDLRLMKYPSRRILSALGKWGMAQVRISQDMIDQQLDAYLK